jgi:hypothetical protein
MVRCSLSNGYGSTQGCSGLGLPQGLGGQSQQFNYSSVDGALRNAQGGVCLSLNVKADEESSSSSSVRVLGKQVVGGQGGHPGGQTAPWPPICNETWQQWDPVQVTPPSNEDADEDDHVDVDVGRLAGLGVKWVQFKSRFSSGVPSDGGEATELCLTADGGAGRRAPWADPWCWENNNMWRSNTDVLQVWTRVMMEVESMATQGYISRPGAWSFPDCLEIGVAGQSTLSWEESKTNLALFAVTSSPLILGNDPRDGRMQDRVVSLYLNKDMIAVDQQYSTKFKFAGGRIWSRVGGAELWAKPLNTPTNSVAVVLFNRGGTVVGTTPVGSRPPPAHCSDPSSPLGVCAGCFVDDDKPWLSPCDDNATASVGAQEIAVDFSRDIPSAWFGAGAGAGEGAGVRSPVSATSLSATATETATTTAKAGSLSCDVFDVFASEDGGTGKSLGKFKGTYLCCTSSVLYPVSSIA